VGLSMHKRTGKAGKRKRKSGVQTSCQKEATPKEVELKDPRAVTFAKKDRVKRGGFKICTNSHKVGTGDTSKKR